MELSLQTTLAEISKHYVESVPGLLFGSSGAKLYAAFIPYFGWDCEPSDHAVHASSICLLTENHLREIQSNHDDATTIGHNAYWWGLFCQLEPTPIGNPELTSKLLEWYQNDNDETVGEAELLNSIGQTVASTCQLLNDLEWPMEQFTDDFIVFADCMASEDYEFGLAASVPNDWLDTKQDAGYFPQWLT